MCMNYLSTPDEAFHDNNKVKQQQQQQQQTWE